MKNVFGKVILSIFTMALLFGFVTTGFAQTISGDLRLRHEIVNLDGETQQDQDQFRARVRLNGDLNDTMNFGIGLTTGNCILSGTANEPVSVDLAFAGWTPNNNMTILGGKIKNPLYRSGNNEMLWDDTFNPEGFAVQFIDGLGVHMRLFMNGGYFILNESLIEDSKLIVGQAGVTIGNGTYMTAGATHYYYSVSDESVYEYFGELGVKLSGMSVAIYGNYVKNGVDSWIVGGEISPPGLLALSYNYRSVNYDVVSYEFSDSGYATFVGVDGGKGHEFGMSVDLMKNVKTKVAYFTDPGFDESKVQADLVVSF